MAPGRPDRPPYDAPAHDGAIRYMKEKGWWRAEDQEWQDKRLARLNAVIEAWGEARGAFEDMRAAELAKGNKVADSEWEPYWEAHRAKAL